MMKEKKECEDEEMDWGTEMEVWTNNLGFLKEYLDGASERWRIASEFSLFLF